MFFEKFVNSKFYHYLDYMVRIILTNIITLITITLGLFIFSFGPAILSGVYVVKAITNKYEGPILPIYIKAFKRFYKKGVLISIIYFVFIFLFAFNIYYFLTKMEIEFLWFDFLSFIIMILLLLLSIPGLFHSLLIYTCYEKNSIKCLLVDGLKLSIAFVLRGIVFIVLSFMIVFISLIVPVVLFLISVFLFLLTIEFVLFKAYDKISFFDNMSNKRLEEIISNKEYKRGAKWKKSQFYF